MNSNFGKAGNPQKGSNNFDFDFGLGSGLGSNRPRSLNDQKHQQQQHGSPYSFPSSTSFSATQSKPASSAWSMNKPSWTHQPAATPAALSSLDKPTSMVGDISGKSWTSAAPSAPSARLGIPEKNPNLFGDLVGSALGKTSGANAPLKNAAPASATWNSFSMGNVADSLPKSNSTAPATTAAQMKNTSWGSGANFGSYSTPTNSSSSININNNNRNLGGPSMKSGAGVSASSKKDPFGSLVDFGSKPAVNNVNSAASNNSNAGDGNTFGAFQNASKSSTPPFQSDAFPASINNPMGSASNSGPKMDTFGIPTQEFSSHEQSAPQSTGLDPLDSLFSPPSVSSSAAPTSSGPAQVDDWGLGSEFGGNDDGGTTDLGGLPPPPSGVTASSAKNKGLDNYKQGQYADAIKFLSWAIVLLEKAGDTAAIVEVLSCRASCYKEVGEYKKAVADCSKVLEHDDTNVSVLVQRALLYESTEKYKLGAEDLRTVLKLDPINRVARSTIHRLNQLAG
ncbi:mucin-5AC [Telopea speciosissima]|uniref:mucin-5AC n=1 Tax=Telopea speciosissima TaxID=54955 RepID=UPI001CC432B0|nr:mucin-5AC [Telopea speciosissima]